MLQKQQLTEDVFMDSFCVSLFIEESPEAVVFTFESPRMTLPISASMRRFRNSSSLSVCEDDSDELLPEPFPS